MMTTILMAINHNRCFRNEMGGLGLTNGHPTIGLNASWYQLFHFHYQQKAKIRPLTAILLAAAFELEKGRNSLFLWEIRDFIRG